MHAAQGRTNLREIAHLVEAESLVRAMLVPQPRRRPTIASVMAHPFWWPSQRRLQFLVDLSDRMENEDREVGGLQNVPMMSTFPLLSWKAMPLRGASRKHTILGDGA